jgi:hypothetical protein
VGAETTGTRPAGRYQDNLAASSRIAGQTGSQPGPYARSHANPRKQGRSSIHILPADYFHGALRREFIAFWLASGRVRAGMNVNIWDVNDKIEALVRAARPVDAARLADPDVPLDTLPGS